MLSKKARKFCWRSSLICIETIAVIAVLLAFMAGIAVWRLTSGPVDIGFAKGYIENALHYPGQGRVEMSDIVLHWPELDGPLLLGFQEGQVFNARNEPVLSVKEAAISLSKSHLLIGRISPRALILRDLKLNVLRRPDGTFAIGTGRQTEFAADDPADDTKGFLLDILDQIDPRNQDRQPGGSIFSQLNSFVIEGAQAVIEDQKMGISWRVPRLDLRLTRQEDGLSGEVMAVLPFAQSGNAGFSVDTFTEWDSRQTRFAGAFQNMDLSLLSDKTGGPDALLAQDIVIEGVFEGELSSKGSLLNLKGRVESTRGSVFHEKFAAESLPYRDLDARFLYDGRGQRLQIAGGEVTLEGLKLLFSADTDISDSKIESTLTTRIPEMEHARLDQYWPAGLKEGENSYKWAVKRLGQGVLKDIRAQIEVTATRDLENQWAAGLDNARLRFDFENMRVDYNAPQPPVTNARGTVQLDYRAERIAVDIAGAELAGLDITGAELEFTNIIEKGKGQADIYITLQGGLDKVLAFAEVDPIGLDHRFDLEKVEGQTELQVNLGFPVRDGTKLEQFDIDIRGQVSNAGLPGVVADLDLTGGPYNMRIDNQRFEMTGEGRLAGRPVSLTFDQYIKSAGKPYKYKVEASLTADENLRAALDIDLSEFLAGPLPVDVVYTKFQNSRATADVQADLRPARVFLKPFDYEKRAGAAGQLSLQAQLEEENIRRISQIRGKAPDLTVQGGHINFINRNGADLISDGEISQFTVGETVAGLDFEYTSERHLRLVLSGSFLDLRPFLDDGGKGEEAYDAPPLKFSVNVDRMRTADGEVIRHGKLYADIDGEGRFNQLELDAVAGQGDVYLRYKPDQSGMRVFRLEADDAGAALKAFEVYDNIIGGSLSVYAEPIRGIYDRNLVGVAEISDFKVVNAPALAQLLSIMSLPGLLSALNNEGLTFSKLEAKYDWLYRPQGSLLVLKDGRTSGNSLGLTFEGTFDNAAGTLDANGTIVPLSGLNRMISSIPLLGQILSGGSESVFAATYAVKGDADNPDITVNPLSVLTPGLIRRILFE